MARAETAQPVTESFSWEDRAVGRWLISERENWGSVRSTWALQVGPCGTFLSQATSRAPSPARERSPFAPSVIASWGHIQGAHRVSPFGGRADRREGPRAERQPPGDPGGCLCHHDPRTAITGSEGRSVPFDPRAIHLLRQQGSDFLSHYGDAGQTQGTNLCTLGIPEPCCVR